MQSTNLSNRILLPAKSWFIYTSLLIALVISYIPTGKIPAIPDLVALTLAFWSIREPARVNMGTAFLLGVLVDIANGAAMGQHALAYVALSYLAQALSRRLLWFPPRQQAIHIFPLLLFSQLLMIGVRMLAGAEFPGWLYLLSSMTAAMLWPPLTFLLLWPQYQPEERDENRPI